MQKYNNNTDKYMIKGMLTELTQLFHEVSVVQTQLMEKLEEMDTGIQKTKNPSKSTSTTATSSVDVTSTVPATAPATSTAPVTSTAPATSTAPVTSTAPATSTTGSAFAPLINSLLNGNQVDSQMLIQTFTDLMNPNHVENEEQEDDMPELVDDMPIPVPCQSQIVKVGSQTEKGTTYDVNIMTGTCTCPHFKYSGPLVCKHIVDVQNNPNKHGLTMYESSILKNVIDKY